MKSIKFVSGVLALTAGLNVSAQTVPIPGVPLTYNAPVSVSVPNAANFIAGINYSSTGAGSGGGGFNTNVGSPNLNQFSSVNVSKINQLTGDIISTKSVAVSDYVVTADSGSKVITLDGAKQFRTDSVSSLNGAVTATVNWVVESVNYVNNNSIIPFNVASAIAHTAATTGTSAQDYLTLHRSQSKVEAAGGPGAQVAKDLAGLDSVISTANGVLNTIGKIKFFSDQTDESKYRYALRYANLGDPETINGVVTNIYYRDGLSVTNNFVGIEQNGYINSFATGTTGLPSAAEFQWDY